MNSRPRVTLRACVVIGILLWLVSSALMPRVSNDQDARVFACKTNLLKLHKGLLAYEEKFGALPSESGPKFLLALWTSGVLPHDETHRDLFFCPGIPNDPDAAAIRQIEIERLWPRIEAITSRDTHYAGRNTADSTLSRDLWSGTQCLAADDNEGGPNHADGRVNYLSGDGMIRDAQLAWLIAKGTLSREETFIRVGPDSPVPLLRQVSAR